MNMRKFAVMAAAAAMLAGAPVHAAEKVTYLLPAPAFLPAFAPWVIAKQRGYYEKEGLDVDFQTARGGVDVAKQVGAGNAVVGGAVGDTPLIVRLNDIPVKAVAVLGGGSLAVLAFTKQSGITGPKDLKGKTVTVLSYQDTTYYAMQGMLATVGLTKNDLKIEAAGPANSWKLWSAGKADAIVISPDIVAQGIEAGLKDVTIVPVNQYFRSMAQAILASDQTIKERPALIKSLVQATLRGMKDIMDNPKTAAADFVKAFPQQAEHLAWVEQSMELYDKFVYAGQPKLGVMDEARLASLQKFYVEQGIIEKALPVKDHYTNQFVE